MIRFCFLIGLSLLLGVGSSSAQTVIELRLSNQSGVNLKLLRGNNPGQGNEDGRLAIGETRTVNSVKGRVWSFMAGNQLVASYRTKQQPEQQFEVTNQMVRKAGVKVPAGGNNMTKPAVNQGGGASNEIRGNIGSSLSRTEATQFLQQHNSARREVDVREVSWSTELARYAQEQADRIARSGKITHTKGTPYGENLGAGSGNYSASKAVAGW
ncbi:MAG: CAP domain-containing protein, partial [Verrucomicrobiota bacterium]